MKIRYSNFDTHTLQKRVGYTSFDHVLIPLAKELFERLYQRRMLIRLVGVRLSGLVRGVQQLNLFEDTSEMVRLYLAMDSLRKRFGSGSVRRASGIQMKEFEEKEKKEEPPAIQRQEIDNLKNKRWGYWR